MTCEIKSAILCIKADISLAVWTIDGVPYCNSCYLDWLDQDGWRRQQIERLFDDEECYVDMRVQRRHRKSRVPHPMGAPIGMRA